TYNNGSTATLTATAKPGYRFTNWLDGNTSNPRQYSVAYSTTLTAYFTQDSRDNDGDGLTNYRETVELGTNPNIADTDGDGQGDADEIVTGNNPLVSDRATNEGVNDSTSTQIFIEGWSYTIDDGWQFTNNDLYPFIYSQDEQGWLWFQPGDQPQRRFFHYGRHHWIERARPASASSTRRRVLEYNFTIDDAGDLANIAPYHEITGDLTIKGDAITSLSQLSNLRKVSGNMFIINTNLESLEGLDNLQQIGGGLYLNSNPDLQSPQGLGNLRSIGGHLNLYNNLSLHGFSGAQNLRSVGGDLIFVTNPKMNGLDGLANLKTIGGNITLTNNDSLTSLQTLPNLENFGGQLILEGNDSLPLEQAESFRGRF
ncbi:MAG: hypothetical protein VW879_13495, partial [Opitutae bacterium]